MGEGVGIARGSLACKRGLCESGLEIGVWTTLPFPLGSDMMIGAAVTIIAAGLSGSKKCVGEKSAAEVR